MAKDIIICCGINRSGSTWVYQVIQELYKEQKILDLGFIDENFVSMKDAMADPDLTILAKMHNHPHGLRSFLEEESVRLVYSHRDLRACVLSLMKKTDKPFEKVYKMPFFHQAVLSLNEWKSYSEITYVDYKEIRNDGEKAIKQIAEFLKMEDGNLEKIAEKFSLESQKLRISKYKKSPKVMLKILLHRLRLAPMPKDESSLLHFNHIQSGSIEEWKTVYSDEQSNLVKDTYGEWMRYFKYS